MLLCDYQMFWIQHRQQPLIQQMLDSCTVRKTWEYWKNFFGFDVDETMLNPDIEAMREKAKKMRENAKKRLTR